MTESDNQSLSRRSLLDFVAKASLGTGLLAVAGAEQASASPAGAGHDLGEHDLGARTYNIRDFGAKGDGTTLDTAAVQAAIDTCNKDQGGTVLVPAGVFVIGTIEMKSNVRLYLTARGKLLGSADGKQYHAADAIPLSGDSTLNDGNVGLIFGIHAENVTIDGPGTIDGQGDQFRSATRGVPPPSGIGGNHRPYSLLFYQCKNLRVRDTFFNASAYHAIRIISCSFVWLDGIHIYNRVNHNNDGFHFISCQHVHISNCNVQAQDDACALFGSCKFITVTNCSFSTRWSVFRFGLGEAENITVSNCLIYSTYGCPIKMHCVRGARFENMSFSNLVMNNVTGPISIMVGGDARRPSQPGEAGGQSTRPSDPDLGKPSIVRNISFQGIHATVTAPVQFPDVPFVSGYNPGEILSCIALNSIAEGVLENISFNDVHITFQGGGTAEQAAVRKVPEITGEYYSNGVLPAYALYARNVRGLTLNNIRFQLATPDLRPAVVFDHVEDAAVNGFSAQGNKDAESLLRFTDARDVLLSASRVLTHAAVFLHVEGGNSQGITIDGGDLSKAASALSFGGEASQKSVKLRA